VTLLVISFVHRFTQTRKDEKVKFTTLIPTRRNDGSAVSKTEMTAILQKFWMTFGALTDEGKTNGVWQDGGKVFRDECLKIVVSCDNERLEEAKALVIEVGRQLGQLAMYFEVAYYDGVQILKVE
jgi:hypothetical protein